MARAKICLLSGQQIEKDEPFVCVPVSYKGAQGKTGFVAEKAIKAGYQLPLNSGSEKVSVYCKTELSIKFKWKDHLPLEYNGFVFHCIAEIAAFMCVISHGKIKRQGAVGDFLKVPAHTNLSGFRYIYTAIAAVVDVQSVEVKLTLCNDDRSPMVQNIALALNNASGASTIGKNFRFDGKRETFRFDYTGIEDFMRCLDTAHALYKNSYKPLKMADILYKAIRRETAVDKRGRVIKDGGKRAK